MADDVEISFRLDVVDAVPGLFTHLGDAAESEGAGNVCDDIDLSKGLDGKVNEVFRGLEIADVRKEGRRLASVGDDRVRRRGGVACQHGVTVLDRLQILGGKGGDLFRRELLGLALSGLAVVGDDHRAFRRVLHGQRASHALTGAGHDSNFSFQ